ncbi:hypothetical protein BDV30DRAFT_47924 [Aspergillus minisclerotigenes]|uniref:Uncharacterized protein n=1 Tax=Aspergillus minisclerotigenes TaxID=656917 RepID=A0A5N6JE68_9EURO|nr:hypothetical protein BDV30DRAFT_47924 [Aspergillus minisclerotigenes]
MRFSLPSVIMGISAAMSQADSSPLITKMSLPAPSQVTYPMLSASATIVDITFNSPSPHPGPDQVSPPTMHARWGHCPLDPGGHPGDLALLVIHKQAF